MVELLVRLIDRKNIDWMREKRPTEVNAGCSKAGDIIAIRDEDKGWGKAEGPPEYIRLKIAGKAEDLQHYVKPKYKEIYREYDCPLLDFSEGKTIGMFKYDAEVLEEYTVPTEVPELGIVNIDWVRIKGIVDDIDIRRRYHVLNIETYTDFDTINISSIVSK